MTRCVKSSMIRQLLLLGAVGLITGCASTGGQKSTAPAAPPSKVAPPPAVAPKATPEQRFSQALDLMKHHQTQQAMAAFQALANDYPNDSGPFTNIGLLHLQNKQWDQALQAFGQAVAANPKNAVALVGSGIAYRNKNDYARAEQAYRSALAVKSDDANAHYDLAVLYDVYMHRPTDAITQYRAYRDEGHDDLIVAAWIKALEKQTAATAQSPSAPASNTTRQGAVEKQ